MSQSMILHTPTGGTITVDHFCVCSNSELEHTIDEAWKNIDHIKEKMKMYAIGNPKDMVSDSVSFPEIVDEISSSIDEYWGWLEDEIITLKRAQVVYETMSEWQYSDDSSKNWDPNNQKDWEMMAPDMYAEEREAWKETLAQFNDCPEEIKQSIMTEDVE